MKSISDCFKYWETLEINELTNLYCERFHWFNRIIFYGMRTADTTNWFENEISNLNTCFVSLDYLCAKIENILLNNTNEYNEKLFNIIILKMEKIEEQLNGEFFLNEYNLCKNNKIYLTRDYFRKIGHKFDQTVIFFGIEFDDKPDIFYGTVETFYNESFRQYKEAKYKINKLFTLRKLNTLTPIHNQPQDKGNASIKKVEPIKWQKNSVLLAYLINELKTFGYIDDTNIWAICEQLFIDKKGKPIKATTFSSMVKNYEGNQPGKHIKGKPKDHSDITDLIEKLKMISKEIE